MRGMRRGGNSEASCHGDAGTQREDVRRTDEVIGLKEEIAVLRAKLDRTSSRDDVSS